MFISFLLYIFLRRTHEEQAYDSKRINMAGRQRMLSQRIAKEALHLTEYTQVYEVQRNCIDLQASLDRFLDQEAQLKEGPLYWKVQFETRMSVDSLHEKNKKIRDSFIGSARNIRRYCQGEISSQEARRIALHLLEESDQFLDYLEKMVGFYANDSNIKRNEQHTLNNIAFASVAFTFILLSILFFMPIFQQHKKEYAARMKSLRESRETGKKLSQLLDSEKEYSLELQRQRNALASNQEEMKTYVKELEVARQQLKISETELLGVIHNLPVGAILLQGEELIANRVTTDILGFEAEEINTTKAFFSKVYRQNSDEILGQYHSVLEGSTIAPFLFPVFRKDGERRMIEFGGHKFERGVVWTLNDVTDKRRAEQSLQRNEEAIRKLYSISADPTSNFEEKVQKILELGTERFRMPTGVLTKINADTKSYKAIYGFSAENKVDIGRKLPLNGTLSEMIFEKKDAFGFHNEETAPEFVIQASKFPIKAYLGAPIITDEGIFGTLNFNSPKISKRPFSENDLDLLRLIARWIGSEITAEKSRTDLIEARDKAESAARAKSEFLATMSHEIRTPMNGVIGMTSLLLQTSLDPEQKDYVNTIRLSGDTLLSIINDILDFSKIEAGNMDLEEYPFSVKQCVEESIELLANKVAEKDIELIYSVDPKIPNYIIGDITRLRQILINLLTNAIKFTAAGEIEINVELDHFQDGKYTVHFSVRDTGIGMSEKQQEKLFKAFSQADSSTTRKYGGTGLGLAISQRLTKLMKGEIWVESHQGQGSTFHFTINVSQAEDQEDKELEDILMTLKNRKALLIDDNHTNLRVLLKQLRIWGMQAFSESDPRIALETALKQEVDIVITDYEMPMLNGLELSRELHKAKPNTPIVMLSSAYLDLKEQEKELLFRYYLSKPAKHSQLLNCLGEIFKDAKTSQGLPKEQAPREEQERLLSDLGQEFPLRILLAEDNAVNQKLAVLTLKKMGYDADIAANGLEVIEALERQEYDLIFMDIQMPEMDGMEATKAVHENYGAKRPTIIAMTANAMEGDREKFLAVGMDDYVTKPINLKIIQNMLRKVYLKEYSHE